MRNLFLVLTLVVSITGFSFNAGAQPELTVVVPNSFTNVQGGFSNSFPLSCSANDSLRYQELYAAEQIETPGSITEINFRLFGMVGGLEPSVIQNLQIDMSITSVEPENASTTFANNLGPVVQTVFNGDLTISAPDCTTNPCNFDVMVPLQTPFLYDPNQGNLIVDWRVNDCQNLSKAFDTDFGILNTELVRIFSIDVDNETGVVDELALITQFVIAIPPRNIPTLSEWGLIAMAGVLGLVGFMVMRRNRATA